MTRKFSGIKDQDIRNSLPALKRAAKRALREGLETGTPVWVIKNGRMVDLTRGKRRKGRGRQAGGTGKVKRIVERGASPLRFDGLTALKLLKGRCLGCGQVRIDKEYA